MAKKDDELNVNKNPEGEKKATKKVEEESTGSKVVTALIVIVIILIWLGIFIVFVKANVGGFGENVLTPVLKDVPVVNKILPDTSGSTSGESYDYTLEEAIARIKELEMQLDSQSSSSGVDSNYIAELEAEITRLQQYEKQQEEFAQQKKEFDEEVVYAENAPDIAEYQKYYEQIDPENAAEIYRQVVEEVQYNQKVQDASDRYASMDPASAAQILDQMTSADLDLVCEILDCMDAEKSSLILQEMDSNVAAKITKRMLSRD